MNLLHPDFRLNRKTFSSLSGLKDYAVDLSEGTEKETRNIGRFILEWLNDDDCITVHTSGSTGTPKEITLKKDHVINSAKATISYFNLKSGVSALLCLPTDYIAGKMMLVRAMIGGWDLTCASPEKNPLGHLDRIFDFTAMVPYQVWHSMADLDQVKNLIIGGGAIPKDLESRLKLKSTTCFATYGMTETISHVAIRPLGNDDGIYHALPNVHFSQTEAGCLKIHAPLITDEILVTNDVVQILSPTSFLLFGRMDNVINTGGIKVHPEIVEEKLSELVSFPFFIASEKDESLGERVIMVVENDKKLTFSQLSKAFDRLSKYEIPKKIVSTPRFIYTETGKIKRQETLKSLTS